MGLLRRRGSGGSVLPVWINGFVILVEVSRPEFSLGTLTGLSLSLFGENAEEWLREVAEYGKRDGGWD